MTCSLSVPLEETPLSPPASMEGLRLLVLFFSFVLFSFERLLDRGLFTFAFGLRFNLVPLFSLGFVSSLLFFSFPCSAGVILGLMLFLGSGSRLSSSIDFFTPSTQVSGVSDRAFLLLSSFLFLALSSGSSSSSDGSSSSGFGRFLLFFFFFLVAPSSVSFRPSSSFRADPTGGASRTGGRLGVATQSRWLPSRSPLPTYQESMFKGQHVRLM